MPHKARANCWFWSPLDLPPGPYRGPTHGTQPILVECINGNEANAGTEWQGNWPILGHSTDGFFNTLSQSPIRRGQMEWLIGALQEFILQFHSKREECKFSSSVCHHLVWLPYPTQGRGGLVPLCLFSRLSEWVLLVDDLRDVHALITSSCYLGGAFWKCILEGEVMAEIL